MGVYVSGAPFYDVPGGTIAQAVDNGDGWEFPLAYVDDDGRHVTLVPDGDPRIAAWFASELGFDPFNKRVAANGVDVEIYSPLSGQWVPAVATGSGGVMPLDMARAAGQTIIQYLREPKETNQFAEFAGTVAQIAATFAAAYSAGSFIDAGIGSLSNVSSVESFQSVSVFDEVDAGLVDAFADGGVLPAVVSVEPLQAVSVFDEVDAGLVDAFKDGGVLPESVLVTPQAPVSVFDEVDAGLVDAFKDGGVLPAGVGVGATLAPAASGLLGSVGSVVSGAAASAAKALGLGALNAALAPDRASVATVEPDASGNWLGLAVAGIGLVFLVMR